MVSWSIGVASRTHGHRVEHFSVVGYIDDVAKYVDQLTQPKNTGTVMAPTAP